MRTAACSLILSRVDCPVSSFRLHLNLEERKRVASRRLCIGARHWMSDDVGLSIRPARPLVGGISEVGVRLGRRDIVLIDIQSCYAMVLHGLSPLPQCQDVRMGICRS
jgi:hypothetical protein